MSELRDALMSPWALVGFLGQIAFTLRFLVQWITSEKRGYSVVPISFWYLSIVGAFLLLVYAIARRDPVFILGQSFGSIVYIRNLVLLGRASVAQKGGPHSQSRGRR